MTDFLEGVTPQPYGGARDEIEVLRANLALMTGWRDAAIDEIESLRAQLERTQQEYMSACGLVADMHAAATGRPGEGPVRGVVEDVADLRHQLQDMERERDVSRGNAQMHMEAARDLAMQLEAAQADAERYRWLRERLIGADFDWQGCGPAVAFTIPKDALVSANCDKTIDGAMLKARGTK